VVTVGSIIMFSLTFFLSAGTPAVTANVTSEDTTSALSTSAFLSLRANVLLAAVTAESATSLNVPVVTAFAPWLSVTFVSARATCEFAASPVSSAL